VIRFFISDFQRGLCLAYLSGSIHFSKVFLHRIYSIAEKQLLIFPRSIHQHFKIFVTNFDFDQFDVQSINGLLEGEEGDN
jgi:hypothetical protein